jgi:hypothetical protein
VPTGLWHGCQELEPRVGRHANGEVPGFQQKRAACDIADATILNAHGKNDGAYAQLEVADEETAAANEIGVGIDVRMQPEEEARHALGLGVLNDGGSHRTSARQQRGDE